MKTRLPPELFGDALMVLEFLNAFGELFDLKDEFPDGVTLGKMHLLLINTLRHGILWHSHSLSPNNILAYK